MVKVLCFDTLLEVFIPGELQELLWDSLACFGGGNSGDELRGWSAGIVKISSTSESFDHSALRLRAWKVAEQVAGFLF